MILVCKTRIKLDFFEIHTSLGSGAQKLLKHKWRNLKQLPFISAVLVKKLDRLFELVFFIYVSGFRLKFSRIAPLRKRLQLDSKSDLTTNGLILDYFVGIWFPWLTSYLYGLKFAWIAQVCFSFDDIKSFRWLVWVVFWSVLKNCPFLSAIEFFKIDWWDLTMHFNFTLYLRVSSSVSFVASVDEITTNSSENHIDRFPNFFKVNCLLIFYSVYCKSFFFPK